MEGCWIGLGRSGFVCVMMECVVDILGVIYGRDNLWKIMESWLVGGI